MGIYCHLNIPDSRQKFYHSKLDFDLDNRALFVNKSYSERVIYKSIDITTLYVIITMQRMRAL